MARTAGAAQTETGTQVDQDGWTVSHTAHGDLMLSPSVPLTGDEERQALIGFENSLTPGSIYFTGEYKTVAVSGPHVTRVPVYKRSYQACFSGNPLWRQCTSGVIVFASGYATCGSSCTIMAVRGSHACGTGQSAAVGFDVKSVGCGEIRFRCGVALSLWEEDDSSVVNPLPGHRRYDWHINAYSTGAMTGPYNGKGADPTC